MKVASPQAPQSFSVVQETLKRSGSRMQQQLQETWNGMVVAH